MPIMHSVSQKTEAKRVFSLPFYEAWNLILKWYKDMTEKKNNIFNESRCKNSQQNISKSHLTVKEKNKWKPSQTYPSYAELIQDLKMN